MWLVLKLQAHALVHHLLTIVRGVKEEHLELGNQ